MLRVQSISASDDRIAHRAIQSTWWLCLLFFLPHFPEAVWARDSPVGAARYVSQQVRHLEDRLKAIEEALPGLPDIPLGPRGGSLGYHAKYRTVIGRHHPIWVTIDLQAVRPIEAVVIVPANVVHGTGKSRGYGFPRRYRLEMANKADFSDSQLVFASASSESAVHPAHVFPTPDTQARYIRLTTEDLWVMQGGSRAVFALGELLVFSNGRNIAPGKPVQALDSIEGRPLWSVHNLVDGQSTLGHAIKKELSATNGYHSAIEQDPVQAKWVQVDLGKRLPIQEVRVFPARPIDWAESHGFGFPEHFRIEVSDSPTFEDPKVLLDHASSPFPNPGDNPIILPQDDLIARFVRFTATRLWKREADYVFALAEIQVFSKGQNVALHAPVQTSNTLEDGLWSKDYLVDGFDSQYALEDDELDWVQKLVHKQSLLDEKARLSEALIDEVGAVSQRLVWTASIGGLGLTSLAGVLIFRGRRLRRRETDRIRERIASDLHDEIGSNLGSISLLSEWRQGEDDEMNEIHRIASETADSMRDIAWVIRSGHDTLKDLLQKMRETASTMLRQTEHHFLVTPTVTPGQRISLDFKRNVLLFFKEALHNILRHAQATNVSISIEIHGGRFSMKIEDDGVGFDPEADSIKAGGGLKNLAKRARTLGGQATIQSKPGQGSLIALEVRLSS